MADETRGGDEQVYDWEGEPDLTDLSEEELGERLKALVKEERDLSYRRRVVQGRIDLIRSELVRRGGAALSPEELARVLMGGGPSGVPGSFGESAAGEG
jgi:hypothetical protein